MTLWSRRDPEVRRVDGVIYTLGVPVILEYSVRKFRERERQRRMLKN